MSYHYQHDFLCTYQYLKNDDEKDICYKMQFLQAFNISDYDDNTICDITNQLYDELKDNSSFIILLKKLKIKIENRLNFVGFLNGTEESKLNDKDIFYFVFSFDYFHKFHKEYSQYKNNLNYNFDFIS